MGLRFDWEIEAEKTQVQRTGESAEAKRKRRVRLLRLFIFLAIVIGFFGGIAALIVWRLDSVEQEIEQTLRSTVDAEFTALRLGDYASFASIQRSASADWLQVQQQIFNQYQDLKMQDGVQLSGTVSDIAVERSRARVSVQEIVNGIPYTRVWFYWRYEDGWRHVPPDYTFWGALEVQKVQNVTVRYNMVDKTFAQSVAEKMSLWSRTACEALACAVIPEITVEVVPDEALQTAWAAGDDWRMQIPSPYIRRARTDMPFEVDAQLAVAEKLADRLILQASNNMQPVYPTDAYYLRQAVVSWLVGNMAQVDTGAYIVGSLATNYGAEAVGQLVHAMAPDSNLSLLTQVTGKPVEQAGLDWRDYLTWRLELEDELLQKRDEASYLALYDTRDEAARNLAYQRFSMNEVTGKKQVSSVQSEIQADGTTILRVVVIVGEGAAIQQTEITFRLADGVWKRVN
ncbi:MAG: hypothetical protein LCI00_05805 [Chloroflexi bacterium]|nr:hypothetical protein [Chloroflexota bacterium]MCC6896510.1 hypothetical protein [Anaerolineae bacterium]